MVEWKIHDVLEGEVLIIWNPDDLHIIVAEGLYEISILSANLPSFCLMQDPSDGIWLPISKVGDRH